MPSRRTRAGRWRRCAAAVSATAATALALAGSASAQPTYGVVPQDGALPVAEDLDLMPQGGVASA